MLERFNELSMNYSDETADEFSKLQEQIDAVDGWNLETTLEIAMDALRLPPGDADVSTLSGGEKRRVAMCRLLLRQPDLLLLDEPTNHLDAESVAWLEGHLRDYPGTVVAVTHDRYFLDNVAGWILELDRGRGIPFKGNYSSWLEQKQERLKHEEKQESVRQRTINQELEWVRLNASARRGKPKARLNNYERLLAEDRNVKLDQVQIHIPAGPRLGDDRRRDAGPAQGLRRPPAHRRPLVLAPARRDRRDHRRQRRGQDDAVPDDRRPGRARRRHAARRRDGRPRLRRPEPRRPRRRQDGVGGDLRRLRPDRGRRPARQLAGLHRGLQLQGHRPAEEGRKALRRRAQPAAPREAAAQRRQPAAARRADERPRRRHPARARGGAARRSPAAR